MKTYEAIYKNGIGEVVYRVRYEVENYKEAWRKAQQIKKQTPEIQQAGRVKTEIGSVTDALRGAKVVIRDIEKLMRQYKRDRAKGLTDKIDFLECDL